MTVLLYFFLILIGLMALALALGLLSLFLEWKIYKNLMWQRRLNSGYIFDDKGQRLNG